MYKFKEEFLDEGEQKINLFFCFPLSKKNLFSSQLLLPIWTTLGIEMLKSKQL